MGIFPPGGSFNFGGGLLEDLDGTIDLGMVHDAIGYFNDVMGFTLVKAKETTIPPCGFGLYGEFGLGSPPFDGGGDDSFIKVLAVVVVVTVRVVGLDYFLLDGRGGEE